MILTDYFWQNIFLLSGGAIGTRFLIIALSSRITISERTKEIFSYIPAAIIPALITPVVFFHHGAVAWAMGKERFLVLIFSTVICYLTRSTLATIVFGLVALYAMTYLI